MWISLRVPDPTPPPNGPDPVPATYCVSPPPEPVSGAIDEDAELDDEPSSAPIWLAHADRCWKAEEANATRLAARANLVLSGVTAIIGLKLFAIGKEVETILAAACSGKATLFWVFGIVSALLLLTALIQVLGIRRWELTFDDPPDRHNKPPSASTGLGLSQDILKKPFAYSEEDACWECFSVTYDAFTDLQERNAKRKEHVDSAQRKLFWAILTLAITMGLYTWVAHENRAKEEQGGGVHTRGRVKADRDILP